MSLSIGNVIEFIQSMFKSSTNEGGYGGGMAGAAFDPIGFIKKPQVILRLISLIFALIVFGSIASEDLYKQDQCPLNGDPHACGFGIAVGVLAFLICLLFLIVDARFDSFSNVQTRKKTVIADTAISGAWTFIWFVCFCYLADAWRKTSHEVKEKSEESVINTAIAFSFFSIITWAVMCLLSFLRYRQGVATIFSGEYDEQNHFSSVHDQGGNDDPNMYRQAPFNQPMNNSGYQQPTY